MDIPKFTAPFAKKQNNVQSCVGYGKRAFPSLSENPIAVDVTGFTTWNT